MRTKTAPVSRLAARRASSSALITIVLLCTVLVIVQAAAASHYCLAARDHVLAAASQPSPKLAPGSHQPLLLASTEEVRLWGIEWSSHQASINGLTFRDPLPVELSSTGEGPKEIMLNTPLKFADEGDTVLASAAITTHLAYLPFISVPEKPVVPEWETILWDDFEGAWPGPWQLKNESSIAPYWWAQRDCRPYRGDYSARAVGTNSGSPVECGANYPGNLWTLMTYGPFSLSDAAGAELTFQLWLNSVIDEDKAYWGASSNGEDFWGVLMSGRTGGWQEITLDLRYIPRIGNLAGKPEVWIVLAFISSDEGALPEGAYVDDVLLRKSSVMPEDPVWQQFSWIEYGKPARGCYPEDPAGDFCHPSSNAEPVGPPPWVLDVTASRAMLQVTAINSSDSFDVFDSGEWLGQIPSSNLRIECLEPDACWLTPGMAAGEFPLDVGQHSITIVPRPIDSNDPYYQGNGFFRLDRGGLSRD